MERALLPFRFWHWMNGPHTKSAMFLISYPVTPRPVLGVPDADTFFSHSFFTDLG